MATPLRGWHDAGNAVVFVCALGLTACATTTRHAADFDATAQRLAALYPILNPAETPHDAPAYRADGWLVVVNDIYVTHEYVAAGEHFRVTIDTHGKWQGQHRLTHIDLGRDGDDAVTASVLSHRYGDPFTRDGSRDRAYELERRREIAAALEDGH